MDFLLAMSLLAAATFFGYWHKKFLAGLFMGSLLFFVICLVQVIFDAIGHKL